MKKLTACVCAGRHLCTVLLPVGTNKVELLYIVCLSNAGDFALPPSRFEALYAPEVCGEAPTARVKLSAGASVAR